MDTDGIMRIRVEIYNLGIYRARALYRREKLNQFVEETVCETINRISVNTSS